MRYLVLIVFALSILAAQLGAQSVVQGACSPMCGGTSCSATFTNPVTAGNTIVAGFFFSDGNGSTVTISDNNSNVYGYATGGAINPIRFLFSGMQASSGVSASPNATPTVTITTPSSSAYLNICVAEITGLRSNPMDQEGQVNVSDIGPAGVPFNGPSIITTAPKEILIAYSCAGNDFALAGPGWTDLVSTADGGAMSALTYKIVTSIGTYAPSFVSNFADDHKGAMVMSFMASGGGFSISLGPVIQ